MVDILMNNLFVRTISLNQTYGADCVTMIFGIQLFSKNPENVGHND
jgi:hypothetical protein